MTEGDLDVVARAWRAFSDGDLETIEALLDPAVSWHGASGDDEAEDDDGGEDGACHSREEALAFIRRSVAEGVSARALELRPVGARVLVTVQVDGVPEGRQHPHGELVTVRDGRITEMLVFHDPGSEAGPSPELHRLWLH